MRRVQIDALKEEVSLLNKELHAKKAPFIYAKNIYGAVHGAV